MFIDLQNVPEDGQDIDMVVPRASVRLDDDTFTFASDISVKARLEPTSEVSERSYRLKGALKGRLDVVCVRCLERFEVDLEEGLDLLYVPQSENAAVESGTDDGGEGRALAANELSVAFYRDDQIDLGQMVLEQAVLSLPMKPLCRPDCQGLCPSCGVNRNEASCECRMDENDPRWDGLKALLGS